jgi:hypothetical protein
MMYRKHRGRNATKITDVPNSIGFVIGVVVKSWYDDTIQSNITLWRNRGAIVVNVYEDG